MISFPTGLTPEQYNHCVDYYLSTEVNARMYNLSEADKIRLCELFHGYYDILEELFFVQGEQLTNYIKYGNEFYEALKNPHDGVDFTPSPMVIFYKEWLAKNKKPFPVDEAKLEGLIE